MTEIVTVKEERASPVPDTGHFEEQETISIKLEEDWEEPAQNIKEEDISPDVAVKIETLDEQGFLEQNEGVFNKTGISNRFLAIDAGKNTCEVCCKSFSNSSNLQRHKHIHRKKYECKICNKQYVSQELLKKHNISTHGNTLYPCDICWKIFKRTSNLTQHKKVHLVVKPFKCGKCNRGFAVKANYIKHQTKICKPVIDEPLTCPVCNKEFQKKVSLKSHLRKHDTDKPFICDLCGLDFKYKSAIIRHMQWHSGYRPCKCPFCDKTFTHSGLIKPHLRTHTGEKPYQCSICLKYFTHKHNMERHKINHGRIKRLVCDICNKKFPRESRLIYHMKTHTREKFFDCGKCDKKFTHKSNVLRHYERKHPGFTYDGTDTDASVALRVWERVKNLLQPHYDVYQQPEEILG